MERSVKTMGFRFKDADFLSKSGVEFAGGSQYDFTYLERFVVYNYLNRSKVFYKMLDKLTGKVSLVCESDEVLPQKYLRRILNNAYNAAKYTGIRVSCDHQLNGLCEHRLICPEV